MTITDKSVKSLFAKHAAYTVRHSGMGECFWTPVGTAWIHADRKGFTIVMKRSGLEGIMTFRAKSKAKR